MKTFRTVGSGSTQTIEPIENNKIPVYETKAAAETDLANLEVGQIIATKDEGNELSNPVDVVQDGNMHAVTSNAVASLFSTISEEKILQDNNNVKISYIIWGKIIIFLAHAKTTFDSYINIDIPLISTPEGVKSSLLWNGESRGEMYLRNNGTEIAIDTTGESSGQVVWFIA